MLDRPRRPPTQLPPALRHLPLRLRLAVQNVLDRRRSRRNVVWRRTAENDELRRQTFGDQPHWYLAPLCCWPEHQGKGVGKRLLNWAIERADKSEPVQPLFLESAPSARVVYLHVGFVPVGERTAMMRRGPKKVEVEDGQKKV
jgi:GNAT superfamily N-acetyltransferase